MIAVAIVVACILLIGLLLPYVFDLNRYRDQYLPFFEQVLHRTIQVDDVQLTLFPTLGVRLRNLVIADDPAFSSKPFLTVPSMQVAIRWQPLLQRRIEIKNVLIESPILQVIRSNKGLLNTSTLGRVSPSGQVSDKNIESKDSVSPLLGVLAVRQFSLKNGTLVYQDRIHQIPKVYEIKQLVLNTDSVAIGETARVDMQGIVMPYQIPLDVKGRFGPLQANFDIPELDIVAQFGNVGVMTQGHILQGHLVADIQIPKASSDDVPIKIGFTKPVALSQLQAHLEVPLFPGEGGSRFGGVKIDSLHANLHFGKSSLRISGKGTPSRFSLILDSPIIFSHDFPVALPLQQSFSLKHLECTAEIQGETLRITSFNVQVFHGTLKAQGTLDALRLPLSFSTQGTFKDFSMESFVKIVKPSSLSMAGVGDLDWKIHGTVALSKVLVLDGPAHLTIRDGEVIGFDVVKTVEDALSLSGVLGESTGITKFSVIDAKTHWGKGGLAIQSLRVQAPHVSLQSTGALGWDQSIAMQGVLTVSPSMADKIIQHFPLAKTIKQEGQLLFPIIVQGTIQDPKFRLDTKFLGSQISKNLGKRLEKVLKGDNQELQKLLDEGRSLLNHFFRK